MEAVSPSHSLCNRPVVYRIDHGVNSGETVVRRNCRAAAWSNSIIKKIVASQRHFVAIAFAIAFTVLYDFRQDDPPPLNWLAARRRPLKFGSGSAPERSFTSCAIFRMIWPLWTWNLKCLLHVRFRKFELLIAGEQRNDNRVNSKLL